jgi:hypothetical protein
MKIFFRFLFILFCFANCSGTLPLKEDYLGVYRIIKIIENNETIKALTLNQIELTENFYISSIDRDGDNQFTAEEIKKSTYVFGINEKKEPYITITGNDSIVVLLPDNYYDLLLKRFDKTGVTTDVYLKKVR